MIAGSGSFSPGSRLSRNLKGVVPPAAPIREFDLGVANKPECTPGNGYGWQKYQQYCDEFFALGAGEKRLFQPPGWTVAVLTETLCGNEARRRVNWFLVQHLLTYNMEHEWFSILVTPYHFELVGPRFESMTRILWRRLRQDDGRCQIACRLAVEGASHYDRSAGPALTKVASPPRRLFPAPK